MTWQLQSSVMARYPPTESRVSLSVSTWVKGDALKRGNYCGLKLTEQVMKVLERIVDGLIRQVVSTVVLYCCFTSTVNI